MLKPPAVFNARYSCHMVKCLRSSGHFRPRGLGFRYLSSLRKGHTRKGHTLKGLTLVSLFESRNGPHNGYPFEIEALEFRLYLRNSHANPQGIVRIPWLETPDSNP